MDFSKYMNHPIEYERTDDDVINDYELYMDARKVAKIWKIKKCEVIEILRKYGISI